MNRLNVTYKANNYNVCAVNDISFSLNNNEVLGIVGESGSGKSTIALAILRLLKSPPAFIEGNVYFKDRDLMSLDQERMRKIRGKEISMVFQDPLTSMNPIIKIAVQIYEPLLVHKVITKRKHLLSTTEELLTRVKIADAKKRISNYPFQLSGGMNQRAMIAMALSCNPEILIADEPTTALDVSIQAQILELIKIIKNEFSMGIIWITHDMDIINEICNKVLVLYCGYLMEYAEKNVLFQQPIHPYTRSLFECLPPKLTEKDKNRRIRPIPGYVHTLSERPSGCVFYNRCREKMSVCKGIEPKNIEYEKNHWVKCHLYRGKR